MTTEMDEKQLRAKQYWYVDGTYEFNMAGICILLTFYFLALAKFEGTKLGGILSVAMILVFVGGMYGVNWLIRLLKTRITFPRTGYVSYKRETGKKRVVRLAIMGAIAGIISALLSFWIIRSSATFIVYTSRTYSLNWLPAFTGVMMAIAAIIFAVRMRIPRFYGVAGLSVVIGVATMFIPADMNTGMAIYYGIMGVALLVVGGVVLSKYLRSTAPPEEGDHE
jgi:hypothetical protein